MKSLESRIMNTYVGEPGLKPGFVLNKVELFGWKQE